MQVVQLLLEVLLRVEVRAGVLGVLDRDHFVRIACAHHDPEGLPVACVFHQLLLVILLGVTLRGRLLMLLGKGFILVGEVFLQDLSIETAVTPVVILAWVLFVHLNFPGIISKLRLLLPGDNLHSIPEHVNPV